MKKLLFYLMSLFVITSCSDDDELFAPNGPSEESGRTLLAYVVSNNGPESDDLSEGLKINLVEMYSALGEMEHSGKLLIYFRPKLDDPMFTSPVILEFETDGKGNVNGKPFPQLDESMDPNKSLVILSEAAFSSAILHPYADKNQDSTSPEVMTQVIQDMKQLAPADRYGIMFSSHGTGWMPASHHHAKSFGDDGGENMDIDELHTVLKHSFTDSKLDFVLFDACLMGVAEVFYELRDVADYCVASSFVIPGAGFPYEDMMEELYADKINYQEICDEYTEQYKEDVISEPTFVTCSAVDLSKMQEVADCVKKGLEGKEEKLHTNFYKNVQSYYYVTEEEKENAYLKYLCLDLVDFFRQMDGSVSKDLSKLMDQAVVAKSFKAGKNIPLYEI